MPSFDIVRKTEVAKSFRTEKIKADFDIANENVNERFSGKLELPETWQIGLVVGGSGTGKTTIAKELFGDNVYKGGLVTIRTRQSWTKCRKIALAKKYRECSTPLGSEVYQVG